MRMYLYDMSSQLFVSLLIVLLASISCTSATTFKFTSFVSTNPSTIKFFGDASTTDLGVIELNRNQADGEARSSHGRAVYANQVRLYDTLTHRVADFTTHFTFAINGSNNGDSSNHLAFFLAPTGNEFMAGRHNSLSSQVVAIRFNHMGFSVDPLNSSATTKRFNGELKGEAIVGYSSGNQILFALLTYQNRSHPSTFFQHINLTRVLPEHVIIGFSAFSHQSTVVHRILKWELRSNLLTTPAPSPSPANNQAGGSQSLGNGTNSKRIAALAACLVVLILIGVAVIIMIIIRKKKKKEKNEEVEDEHPENDAPDDNSVRMSIDFSTGPRRFSYGELTAATNYFSEESKLGQGGFGGVYHGTLVDTREPVAVKRFAKGSNQGKKEYVAEVTVISRLRHRNLVRLIGWCHEQGELMLVYEYMEGGSLDRHLFGPKIMPWARRRKVALGLASALLYLHEEWEQCVLHRDIKTSNVMIDSEFNPRLGDFGLARFIDHGQDGCTTVVAGTMGYLAPECVISGKSSMECDVYSYGIVLLELATGLRASRPVTEVDEWLVEWVWNKYGAGLVLEAVDKRLGVEYDKNEAECMMVVGLWCLHPDAERRPSIGDAILVMSFQAELPRVSPKMPVLAFYEPIINEAESVTLTSSSRTTTTTTTAAQLTSQSLLPSYKAPQQEAWSYII